MQYVRTRPASSTTTWLCSHVISGKCSSTIWRERRPTAGICSSPTSKCRSTRYLGILPPWRVRGSLRVPRGERRLDRRRVGEGLEHDAVALRLLAQRGELFLRRLGRGQVEA